MTASPVTPSSAVHNSPTDIIRAWLSPRRTWSAADHALAALIDSLRTGTFEVGERLPSLKELSAVLGTSHVITREALEVLAGEGILDIRRGQGGGIFVSGITGFPDCLRRIYAEHHTDHMQDLITTRAVLEREVALLAMDRAATEGLAALDTLLTGMAETLDQPAVFVELSVRFELRLALLGGNDVMIEFVRDVLNRMAVLATYTGVQVLDHNDLARGHATYAALVDGIRQRSRADVEQAIDKHIEHLREVVSRTVYGGNPS